MYFMVAVVLLMDISCVINIRNDDLIKAFGERVRTLRKERGYTMEHFAGLIGIDYRQLSNIERGKVNTTISSMNVIAVGFKISLSELVQVETLTKSF